MAKGTTRLVAGALWIAAMLATPALWADNQLNCTVKDESGSPVAKNTEVVLKADAGKDSGKTWSKKTDDKGDVEFKGLQDGTYSLHSTVKEFLLTNAGPINLAGNAKQTCNAVSVSITKLNDLLNGSMAALKAGNVDDAVAQSKSAVDMAPSIANTHFMLALSYAYKGMVDEAMAEGNKAAQLDKSDESKLLQIHLQALSSQAGADMNKKDFDGALKAYQQAQQLAPNEGLVYRNLAVAYLRKGDLSNAMKNIDKAVELNPADQEFMQLKTSIDDQYLKSTQQILVK